MTSEPRLKRRVLILAGAIALFGIALAARLVDLQIVDAEAYRARARDQHEGTVRIEGPRGTIWDRNGREMGVSVQTKSVYVHPDQIAASPDRERIIRGVAAALGQSESRIREKIDNPRNGRFVFLERRLSPRETKAIEDLRLPEIGLMTDSRRFYPRRQLASHLLGFVDIDGKGQAGIERSFDEVLRGEPSTFVSLVDARKRPLMLRAASSGRPGRDLVLTLDETIQELADSELDRSMEETQAKGGTIIVMDPGTGELLALANRPGFDPNLAGEVAAKIRENLAVSFGYEPGSTFKVLTASIALEEGRVRPTDFFDCGNGSITIYGRRVGDHHPYGTLSLAQVIAKSSNVGIIRVGLRVPEKVFSDYVSRFGFGRQTGITLPSEAPGEVQRPGGRTWSGLSQPMMSMGQSIEVTPLQMLTAVSTIANAGERVTPRIVRSITSEAGAPEPIAVKPPTRILSAQTARTIARMMESVVDEGTGRSAAIAGYRVAGKTGTAQKVVNGVYSHTAHVASFVGFAPATDPAIAAIVVLDEPLGKYYGGDVAAPTWARVVGAALGYLRVPPTEPVLPERVSPAVLHARAERLTRRKDRADRTSLAADGRADAHDAPFPAPWPSHLETTPGTMPELFGWNLRDALVSLARAGCRPRISGTGFVIEQTPPAGTSFGTPPACHLTLASEPPSPDREANLGS